MKLKDTHGRELTIKLGLRIMLRNGWTGRPRITTPDGVLVVLDVACRPVYEGFEVVEVLVGDGDIECAGVN